MHSIYNVAKILIPYSDLEFVYIKKINENFELIVIDKNRFY